MPVALAMSHKSRASSSKRATATVMRFVAWAIVVTFVLGRPVAQIDIGCFHHE